MFLLQLIKIFHHNWWPLNSTGSTKEQEWEHILRFHDNHTSKEVHKDITVRSVVTLRWLWNKIMLWEINASSNIVFEQRNKNYYPSFSSLALYRVALSWLQIRCATKPQIALENAIKRTSDFWLEKGLEIEPTSGSGGGGGGWGSGPLRFLDLEVLLYNLETPLYNLTTK